MQRSRRIWLIVPEKRRKFLLMLCTLLVVLTACSYGVSPELDQQQATATHQFMQTVRDFLKIKKTFDERNLSQIEREKTTKQQVVSLLGEPFFKARNFAGSEEWSYRYVAAGERENAEINLLVIEFNDEVVRNYTILPFFR